MHLKKFENNPITLAYKYNDTDAIIITATIANTIQIQVVALIPFPFVVIVSPA